MNCPMPGDEPRRTRMCWNPRYSNPFFAGLVVIAGEFHPIPFRTRPLKPPAPMVLRVNTRESRSPPGLQRTDHQTILILTSAGIARVSRRTAITPNKKPRAHARGFLFIPSLFQIARRVLVQQQRRARCLREIELAP